MTTPRRKARKGRGWRWINGQWLRPGIFPEGVPLGRALSQIEREITPIVDTLMRHWRKDMAALTRQ